jgi:hypothetical protein
MRIDWLAGDGLLGPVQLWCRLLVSGPFRDAVEHELLHLADQAVSAGAARA